MAESSYVFYLTSLDIVHFCHLSVSCYWVCRIDLQNLLPNLLTASFVLETRGLQKRSLKAHLTKCLCFSDSSRWGIIFFTTLQYNSHLHPLSPSLILVWICWQQRLVMASQVYHGFCFTILFVWEVCTKTVPWFSLSRFDLSEVWISGQSLYMHWLGFVHSGIVYIWSHAEKLSNTTKLCYGQCSFK